MTKRLKGKIALITGAARGIGLATAKLFVQEGAFVLMADTLDELGKKEATLLGSSAHYYHLDVARSESWKALMDEAWLRFGGLDILINNASLVIHPEKFFSAENWTVNAWDQSHPIDGDGVFLGCKFGIQYMKSSPRPSAIVNVSTASGWAHCPQTQLEVSRASISDYTKSVALYCAQRQFPIRCNSIQHSGIQTDCWEPYLGKGRKKLESLRKMANEVPLKRLGRPEEVASAVLFLSSDECPFMTGVHLVVDGGAQAASSTNLGTPPENPYAPRAG